MNEQTIPAPARELIPRVHAAARAGVGDLAPSTMRIPNAHYTDPAILEAELRTTFSAPLLVVPSASVPTSGDYRTMDLIGTPVVVVRGADGRARVLLNVVPAPRRPGGGGLGVSPPTHVRLSRLDLRHRRCPRRHPRPRGLRRHRCHHARARGAAERGAPRVRLGAARSERRPRSRRPPRPVRRRAGVLGLPPRRRRRTRDGARSRTGSARWRRSWRRTTSPTSTATRWSGARPWPTSSRSTRSAGTTASACRPSPWVPMRSRPRASTSSSSTTSTRAR